MKTLLTAEVLLSAIPVIRTSIWLQPICPQPVASITVATCSGYAAALGCVRRGWLLADSGNMIPLIRVLDSQILFR